MTYDELLRKIRDQIEDEKHSALMYEEMAHAAEEHGIPNGYAILKEISEDEAKHHRLLMNILSRMYLPAEQEKSRPFPKTYEDWADLGFDIKQRDRSLTAIVDSNLMMIYEGSPAADDSKRWLVRKAWELGIT